MDHSESIDRMDQVGTKVMDILWVSVASAKIGTRFQIDAIDDRVANQQPASWTDIHPVG